MKTLKTISLLIIAASLFAACTADLDKLLVKQDGVWNVDKTTTESYTNGTLDTTETAENDGSITFKEDNTGTWVDGAGESNTFTWSFNADAEQLTMVQDSFPLVFDVLESSAKAQTLQNELSLEFFGIVFKTVTTIELSR